MLKPKKKQEFNSEAELAESIVFWLTNEGWNVYKEVKPLKLNKIADIIATKDDKIWVIESKLVYGLKVLEQAFNWIKYADFVSIAIPRTYNGNIVLDFFLKENGIGRFWVDPSSSPLTKHGYVYLDVSPKFNEKTKKDYLLDSLRDEQKQSIAGSKSGKYVTPYKLTIDQIRNYLKEKGAATLPQIVDSINHHYSTRQSAIKTLSTRLIVLETDFDVYESEGKRFFSLKSDKKQ